MSDPIWAASEGPADEVGISEHRAVAWSEELPRASQGGDSENKNRRCLRTNFLKLPLSGEAGAWRATLLGSGSALWLYSEAPFPRPPTTGL